MGALSPRQIAELIHAYVSIGIKDTVRAGARCGVWRSVWSVKCFIKLLYWLSSGCFVAQ